MENRIISYLFICFISLSFSNLSLATPEGLQPEKATFQLLTHSRTVEELASMPISEFEALLKERLLAVNPNRALSNLLYVLSQRDDKEKIKCIIRHFPYATRRLGDLDIPELSGLIHMQSPLAFIIAYMSKTHDEAIANLLIEQRVPGLLSGFMPVVRDGNVLLEDKDILFWLSLIDALPLHSITPREQVYCLAAAARINGPWLRRLLEKGFRLETVENLNLFERVEPLPLLSEFHQEASFQAEIAKIIQDPASFTLPAGAGKPIRIPFQAIEAVGGTTALPLPFGVLFRTATYITTLNVDQLTLLCKAGLLSQSTTEQIHALVDTILFILSVEKMRILVAHFPYSEKRLDEGEEGQTLLAKFLLCTLLEAERSIVEILQQNGQNINVKLKIPTSAHDKFTRTTILGGALGLAKALKNSERHISFIEFLLDRGMEQYDPHTKQHFLIVAIIYGSKNPETALRLTRLLLSKGFRFTRTTDFLSLNIIAPELALLIAEAHSDSPIRNIRRGIEALLPKLRKAADQQTKTTAPPARTGVVAAAAAAAPAAAAPARRTVSPRPARQRPAPRTSPVRQGFAQQQQQRPQTQAFDPAAIPVTVVVDPLAEARAARAESRQRAREQEAEAQRRASAQRWRALAEADHAIAGPAGAAPARAGSAQRARPYSATKQRDITPQQREATPFKPRLQVIASRAKLREYAAGLGGEDSVPYRNLVEKIEELREQGFKEDGKFKKVESYSDGIKLEYRLNGDKRAYFVFKNVEGRSFFTLVDNPNHLPTPKNQ